MSAAIVAGEILTAEDGCARSFDRRLSHGAEDACPSARRPRFAKRVSPGAAEAVRLIVPSRPRMGVTRLKLEAIDGPVGVGTLDDSALDHDRRVVDSCTVPQSHSSPGASLIRQIRTVSSS